MTLTDFFPFLEGITVDLFIKIPVLLLILLYGIFALILLNKTKSLSKLVFLETSVATLVLNTLALIHLVATILLFLIALAIL